MTPLQHFLTEAGGVVTFETFMRWALYDPQHGYYSRRITDVGRTGDFSTSATLSPVLAQAIAAWASHHRAKGPWHLIEVGPGNGQLAANILHALGWWKRFRLNYHLVETSAPLAAFHQARLHAPSRPGFAATMCWHTTMQDALAASAGNALIISNELVDAFPCVVLSRPSAAADWQEVGIRWEAAKQRAVEVLLDLSAARAIEIAECVASIPSDALRIEIHLAYGEWLRAWRPFWKCGRMLTIDYGDTVETLYHRRPRGTLRGYFRQQKTEGAEIYERAGHQDLTADVNFTHLIRCGEAIDLRAEPLQSQRAFVKRWHRPTTPTAAAAIHLLDPEGAGHAFKVLEQSAGR